MPSIEFTRIIEVDVDSSGLIIALKGCRHLDQLVNSSALSSHPTPLLDEIYGNGILRRLSINPVPPDDPSDMLLITKDKFETIAQEFSDDEIAVLGRRAIAQIHKNQEKIQQNLQKGEKTSTTSTEEVLDEQKEYDPRNRR
jgi:hypothetical protein